MAQKPQTYSISGFSCTIDTEKVREIAAFLDHSADRVLDLRRGPEHVLPKGVEWGSKEHAIFLAYTCCIDYRLRRKADELWQKSRGLFVEHPDKVDPHVLARMDSMRFRNLMAGSYLGMHRMPFETVIGRVRGMAKYLATFVDGDPRRMYDLFMTEQGEKQSARQMLGWLRAQVERGIPGGEKTLRLFFRTMVEDSDVRVGGGMWPFSRDELRSVPLPVDKNILSATIALGLISRKTGSYSGSFSGLWKPIEDSWMSVARRTKKFILLELDEPLWKVGRFCRLVSENPWREKRHYACAPSCLFFEACPKLISEFTFHKDRAQKYWDTLTWPFHPS